MVICVPLPTERPASPRHRDSSALPLHEVQYRVVGSFESRFKAFRLVYDTYIQRGLIRENHFRLRVTPFHLIPTTEMFAAEYDGEIICTLTLIGDGSAGLPLEIIYGDEVKELRLQEIPIGEVSCLAAKNLEPSQFFTIFSELTRLMAQYARARGLHQLLAAVHPKHAKFYQKFLGFQQIGPEKCYPCVEHAPAVACCLDFERIDRDRPKCYDNYFGTAIPQLQLQPCPMPPFEADFFTAAADLANTCLPLG